MPISICIAAPAGANSPSSANRGCRSSFAVLMVGHAIGFLMLGTERQGLAVAAVGDPLLRRLPAEDLACGCGEEFALILPECSL
jgi:hypothetical protein